MIPSLIIVPFAGVIGDKMNRKHIMIAMDVIRGILILFITTVSVGLADSIFSASNSAIITEFLKKPDYIKGNSLMSGINGITAMILNLYNITTTINSK